MKDSYYSVLSSTMNTIMGVQSKENYNVEKYKYIFCYRSIISLCTSQRLAEMLMDARYAYMSSFSHYTNIRKLLVEKFRPPFKNLLIAWVVNKLLKRLPIIFDEIDGGKQILINLPKYINNTRQINTYGGKFRITSVWGNYKLTEVQDILDEAFVYVHTAKEPSNIFHENVNALKTIYEFQKKL
jgi:hypothetical protein